MPNERRWLSIRDFLTFQPKAVLENKRYLFECRDAKSESGHSLLVRVEATHAGIVNGNRKFYRPDFMQDSVASWLPGNSYPRPVLIGHNEDGEVLGRVREATYVDDSWKWATDFPSIKDSIFYSRDSKRRSSLFKSVDWIVANLQPLKDYTGLGHCALGLQITNPEGIRKVLADEYLTVSVGSATDEAICSVCHQDWASDDKCEHKPGSLYDGKRMFLICGRFKYQEVSFVNFPADPFALVKEKELKDSLEKMFFIGLPIEDQDRTVASGLILTDSLYESDIQITEDTMLTPEVVTAIKAALASADLTAAQAFTFKDQVSAWEPASDDDKVTKRSLTSSISIQIRKNNWVRDAAPALDNATQAEIAQVDAALTDEQVQAALTESEDAKKPKPKKCEGCGCDDSDENDLVESSYDGCVLCWSCREKCEDKQGNNAAAALATNIPAKGTGKGKKVEANTPLEKPNEDPAERKGGKKKKKCAACTKDFETETDDAENCPQCSLTDTVKQVIDFLSKDEQTKDANTEAGGALVTLVSSLDAGYAKFPDEDKFYVRAAVRALLDHWSTDDEFKFWVSRLAQAGKLKDSAVVTVEDLLLKDTLIADLTAEKDGFETRKRALETLAAASILDSKKSLASQIVMSRVLHGADGYKGLDTEQILAKVDDLAKRTLVSLKDTVHDILSELEWVTPEPAANQDQVATEPAVVVNDNEQVDESVSAEPADRGDFKVQDTAAYRRALSFITSPAERTRFAAEVRCGRIKF
ncbi:hypothetical protein D4R30_01095 [archaeon]|nr:MAG: hypothetical protein D4R30_01095 [archaeon]